MSKPSAVRTDPHVQPRTNVREHTREPVQKTCTACGCSFTTNGKAERDDDCRKAARRKAVQKSKQKRRKDDVRRPAWNARERLHRWYAQWRGAAPTILVDRSGGVDPADYAELVPRLRMELRTRGPTKDIREAARSAYATLKQLVSSGAVTPCLYIDACEVLRDCGGPVGRTAELHRLSAEAIGFWARQRGLTATRRLVLNLIAEANLYRVTEDDDGKKADRVLKKGIDVLQLQDRTHDRDRLVIEHQTIVVRNRLRLAKGESAPSDLDRLIEIAREVHSASVWRATYSEEADYYRVRGKFDRAEQAAALLLGQDPVGDVFASDARLGFHALGVTRAKIALTLAMGEDIRGMLRSYAARAADYGHATHLQNAAYLWRERQRPPQPTERLLLQFFYYENELLEV